MKDESSVDRRGFLRVVGAGAAGAAAAPMGAGGALAQDHSSHGPTPATPAAAADRLSGWTFFNPDEVTFVKAALDTLIPADATGPGAVEAGCATYIDRQLSGAYGRGARLYLQGPFAQGTPQQGYQLPLTPAELIRIGIADVNAYARKTKQKFFSDLSPADRAAVMTEVDAGKAELANVPAAAWFNMFLNLTMEGYFGDPMYGGNKDKAVWKMIGFPGVPGMYSEIIEQYRNKPYPHAPKSIQDFA
jgi:gluconate 2-dehydrogenase gamma chain